MRTLQYLYVLETTLIVAIFLLSNIFSTPKLLSNDLVSTRHASCWMISFKISIKRFNNLSFKIPFTLRLNFWNYWMCSVTKPLYLIFVNWLNYVFIIPFTYCVINSSIKMDQETKKSHFCIHKAINTTQIDQGQNIRMQ